MFAAWLVKTGFGGEERFGGGVLKPLTGLGLHATGMWRQHHVFSGTASSWKSLSLQNSRTMYWKTMWRLAAKDTSSPYTFTYPTGPSIFVSSPSSSQDELDEMTLIGTPLNFLDKDRLTAPAIEGPVFVATPTSNPVEEIVDDLLDISTDVFEVESEAEDELAEDDDDDDDDDVGFETFQHAGICYTTTGYLGSGASARVMAADAVELGTGRKTEVAVKIFCKQASFLLQRNAGCYVASPGRILNELMMHIRASEIMDNGVVPLLAAFDDEKYVYFVMPRYYETLEHRIRHGIPERVARYYMACLVKAVEELQTSCLVSHSDIKPGNILIDKHGRIALADFGLACGIEFGPNNQTLLRRDPVGTSYYCAPEVGFDHEGRLTRFDGYKPDAADIWSLGAVMFEIYAGIPYDTEEGYNWRMRELDGYTEAQDLLRWMLVEDPAERPSFQQIKEHPFFFPFNLAEELPTHRPLYPVTAGPDGRIEFYSLARENDISLNNPVTPDEERYWRDTRVDYHNPEGWERALNDTDIMY